MHIDKQVAETILRDEAAKSKGGSLDKEWVQKVEHLSKLCLEGISATHIAFLGTSLLAKSVDRRADLFAIKPNHAPGNPRAYSARSLCHGVLVPLAAELGFSIGVSGREPLNNQPYFRMTRLGDDTPVHAGGRAAFDYMVTLVREISRLPSEASARAALRAFIAVRRRHQPKYDDWAGGSHITPDELTRGIVAFVEQDSEGGRRAQAVVAGLLDIFAGSDRVTSGRINDPSRKYPGDVCVRSGSDANGWEKAIEVRDEPGSAHDAQMQMFGKRSHAKGWEKAVEVRDKPVSIHDVQIFGKKCVEMGVQEAAFVMVSRQQELLDVDYLHRWANGFGLGLTIFTGWAEFVDQVLFWSASPKPIGSSLAIERIRERLIAVEASPQAVTLWDRTFSAKQST
jgi:hypothetical protein